MAATEVFANNPATVVTSGGTDAPAGGTPETWTVASSSEFPAASTGVTKFHVGDPAVPSELILVTNVSGTTWSVIRGAESTTPVAHAANFTIVQVVSAGWLGNVAVNPMTAFGDMIYGGTSPTAGSPARLTGGTIASKRFLTQTGGGTVSAAPAWGTISASDVPVLNQNTSGTAAAVSGTVPVSHGGTGLGSLATYAVITGGTNSTSPVQQVASAGTAGQVLTSQGPGVLPAWATVAGGSAVTFPISVPMGGTGGTQATAYALLAGGTSATAPLQQVAGAGTAGQVLTSQGPGVLPQWAAGGSGGSVTFPITVPEGGTGGTQVTAYSVLAGGNTTTAPFQSITSGAGSVGYVLTTNGVSGLPSWQRPTGGSGLSNPMSGVGDMVVGGAGGIATRLANPGATGGMTLTSNGTGAEPSWQFAPVDWINVVSVYGADPGGTVDSTTPIQDALTAAINAGGGVVYLPAGTYKTTSTLTCHTTVPVYIQGAGRWATTLNFSGTGDCLRIYDDSVYKNRNASGNFGGGEVAGLTIDGTSHSGTAASALHMGDIFQYRVDISAQNFSKAGDIGVWFDNTAYWTEQLHARVYTQNCATGVVFDVSAGGTTSTNSFARIDMEADIAQTGPTFDGVVLQNGAVLYDGNLSVRGNFSSSSSGSLSSAVLRLTGQVPAGHPGAGGYSLMFSMGLNVQAECGTGATTPHTIIQNVPGANFVRGCTGVLDFAGAGETFAQSNLLTGGVLTPGAIWFHGPVYGDGSLNPATTGGNTSTPIMILGASLHSRGAASYSTGGTLNIYTHEGDYFLPGVLTQPTTISLNPTGATFGVSQRVAVVLTQAASGTMWTVAWPSSASPTTSSPTVVWAGGVAPVMSTGASATDMYFLETVNGSTWFGYAVQEDVASSVTIDTTAADIQPDGIQSAGVLLQAAAADHIHELNSVPSLYYAPSGATAETFSRRQATAACNSLATATLYVTAIGLPAGLPVSTLTMMTNTTVKSGGSNGWYVLLDSNRIVRAVTANQTDANSVWGTASTPFPLSVASSAYTTTYGGLYYIGVMVGASVTPTFTGNVNQAGAVVTQPPILTGFSSTGQTTPPALGATMATISASSGFNFYAWTS